MTPATVTPAAVIRVKICGLRDPVSALVAAEARADYLGFVFVEGVRRQLDPDEGAAVIAEYRERLGGRGPKLVGLFADQPASFVNEVTRNCGLDFAQLCGSEDADYWERLDAGVIRQIKVRGNGSAAARDEGKRILAEVERVQRAGHGAVLDTFEPGQLGGTGTAFDWTLAAEAAALPRVMLAGGLTAENVGDAIDLIAPWGVDVSSGVETCGVKDHDKIRAFVAAVRTADDALTP